MHMLTEIVRLERDFLLIIYILMFTDITLLLFLGDVETLKKEKALHFVDLSQLRWQFKTMKPTGTC